MNRPPKKARIGRNDPCPCGSGRKYKDCHLPAEQAYRAEQLKLRQAQDTLLPKIIEAAQSVPEAFPAAFADFWQGKFSSDQMATLDEEEDRGSERFLTWFAFDYRQESGETLVEQLNRAAASGGFAVEEPEHALLKRWQGVRLRPYLVEEVRKGQGLTVRDLLEQQVYTLADYGASKRLAVGEVMVGHIVPVDTPPGAPAPTYYLAGAAAQLTPDTAEKLVEFAGLHLEDLRRTSPAATWADLVRERSAVFNHFVTALPRERHDPTILDSIILEARVALQMTGETLSDLISRGKDEPAERARDDEGVRG